MKVLVEALETRVRACLLKRRFWRISAWMEGDTLYFYRARSWMKPTKVYHCILLLWNGLIQRTSTLEIYISRRESLSKTRDLSDGFEATNYKLD